MRVLLASLLFLASCWPAQAKHHYHFRHHYKKLPIHHLWNAARDGAFIAGQAATITAHPAGCPRRAFCGCGVAKHIFGELRPDLWAAASWFRFPRAAPAPGMVAVRPHHVLAILMDLAGGRALAYNPNSGGGKTRIEEVSLRGYTIVNPRGGGT